MFKSFFSKFKKDSIKKFSKDPVCGMRAGDEISSVYKGQTYAFCSGYCKEEFEKNPEAYIAK
ncbi:hypothetical protein A3I27_03680 [Candidatus Giovannonibacteria bacterium RIFCSPLOWO2_02_FULL_43_11b]|uniref:TRASH domain-containing protein n=1 Tax=Candidatus Giovannonibacteria bacterium RIFCSPHIGHO2_12_FULL_43_15 TaxID=1798341 RepID=A0A1F5WP16_9BACT|nr:MAG: hypothetical protein A2739_00860 [Candidatus Giovannonibacteria bacterium RIFCSPHIGHO2_01_FULL_43_100]OGF67331.1 MAG: hypothetical protein A3B97_03365 [Candidatus Giovannonibacteria bacterium RIFCSPHIGHO2_02_FULL_43_32]OGF77344.1 MAG: hypothetical protein A3F23_03545 [Candidatus Giovannonibacteria bacterium RIFCSPHIGHO2_12_FULL_43_15]OGF78934.1 MAG: hypothetical protein A3A15_03095 [Candidatus Giovannonibacteria bacterium RIFCSPLOWO2_01_FULL_43_60]OGF89086.1 MAG: hypothetical protein A3